MTGKRPTTTADVIRTMADIKRQAQTVSARMNTLGQFAAAVTPQPAWGPPGSVPRIRQSAHTGTWTQAGTIINSGIFAGGGLIGHSVSFTPVPEKPTQTIVAPTDWDHINSAVKAVGDLMRDAALGVYSTHEKVTNTAELVDALYAFTAIADGLKDMQQLRKDNRMLSVRNNELTANVRNLDIQLERAHHQLEASRGIRKPKNPEKRPIGQSSYGPADTRKKKPRS